LRRFKSENENDDEDEYDGGSKAGRIAYKKRFPPSRVFAILPFSAVSELQFYRVLPLFLPFGPRADSALAKMFKKI
jgi:hypothetical protein